VSKSKTFPLGRDSKTGQFIPVSEAKRRPVQHKLSECLKLVTEILTEVKRSKLVIKPINVVGFLIRRLNFILIPFYESIKFHCAVSNTNKGIF